MRESGNSTLIRWGSQIGIPAVFAVKDDVIHAGATYVDAEVVVDRNLVTSRKPDDLPAFCREAIAVLVGQAVSPALAAR